MANINEILARAASLRDETALNSIDPERAGGIMYDTLLALNELWLQQGAALVISKIYASVAAMNADTSPVSDLTGKPIRPGMIVVIASSDSDNGSVYRYNGTESPSWSLVGSIGNLDPVDSLDSDSTTLPLAAHQGKVLDGKISQLGQQASNNTARSVGGVLLPNIDFSKVIVSSGSYANSSANNYAKMVDVSNIRGSVISVTRNTTNAAIIAFLCSDDVSTSNPRYCFGYTNRFPQTETTPTEYTIPYDCKYLYVVVWNNNADALPTIVVKDVVNRNADILNYRNSLEPNLVSTISQIWHNNINEQIGNIVTAASNRTVCVLYDVPVGSTLHIELLYGYQVAIMDWDNTTYPKQSSTGWLPGNIIDYTVLRGEKVVMAFKSSPERTMGVLTDYVKSISLFLYGEIDRLTKSLNPELQIDWEDGIPVESGTIQQETYRAFSVVKANELKSTKLFFASSLFMVYFRPWDGVFPITSQSTGWLVRNGEYDITSDFIIIGLHTLDGSAITVEKLKDVRIIQGTDDGVSVAESIERNIFSYAYTGQRIDNFVSHYVVKRFKTLPSWQNMQGGAIYGNNLVCLMAADEIPTASVNGFIYNIETGEKVCDLLFGNTLGGKTYELPHANQVSFGTQFYNSNSRFPLLYVSQVNGSTATLWNNSERGVLVYDLQTEDDGQTFTPVLVQAIIPDLTDAALMEKIGAGTPNYIVDTDKAQVVVLGYPQERWGTNGPQPVAVFDLPLISVGNEVVLTDADIIDSYTFPVSLGIQQSFYFDGKIYSLGGVAYHGSLRVIDLAKKAVVTTIDLTQWTNGEPQFAGLWNGKFLYYNAGTDGVIYEFVFNP